MTRTRTALAAGLLALVAGCGTKAERLFHVSGTATCGGKPIPMGHVHFEPVRGTPGEPGYAAIDGGRFNTAAGGLGIRGGAYVVRILGYDGKVRDDYPMGSPLFNEYEVKKDLPQADSEMNFDVPAPRR
jgi:hypothetical protein